MGAADDLEYIVWGQAYHVAALRKVHKEFLKLPAKKQGGLREIMRIFGNEGGDDLPRTQYVFEARLSIGDRAGSKAAVHCFKDWQVRVYGSVVTVAGAPTFICTEIDTAKKQDKADQGCLVRAAQNLEPFVAEAKEAEAKEKRK